MSESVTRGFREKYKAMIGEAAVYDFMHFRRQNMKRGAAALKRESSSGVDTDKTKPFKNGDQSVFTQADQEFDLSSKRPSHLQIDLHDPRLFLPKKYNRYSPDTRMRIGRVCAEIGPSATV